MKRPLSALPTLRKTALPLLLVAGWLAVAAVVAAHPGHDAPDGDAGRRAAKVSSPADSSKPSVPSISKEDGGGISAKPSRAAVLIGSVTVFVLAVFVGFEIINKVPPTLHTPLMSGSNAISGITVVGAILASGSGRWDAAALLGAVAVVLANINVVGGFLVTHRMLLMFKKR
ncbi:MAG: transhydrogenase subunit alpha [Planctomycetota bacterium]|jgi:NAD(P) transhydrogenase subunit alpha